MNKFAIFAVLSLAAFAVASVHSIGLPDNWNGVDDESEEQMTQAILQTTDAEETAQLAAKKLEAFSDFCISSRDFVLADLKKQSGDMSSKMFTMFFSSAAAIGKESLEVQERATERLAHQLAHPEAQIEGATDGVDKIIAEGQSEIQSGESQPRALLSAFKSAVSAISTKVGNLVSERINHLKSLATPQQLVNGIAAGCEQIATYENEIREQFEEYKKTSLGEDAAKYASLPLDAVPCATATKIIRSEGLCGLVRVIQSPIKKIMATRA